MRLATLLTSLLLVPRLAGAQQWPSQATVPARGFVPDSVTAVRIAVAVWIPLYGETEIKAKQPFVATLQDSVWTVTTSPQPGRYINLGGIVLEGGTAIAKIGQRDARILLAAYR